MAKYFYACNCRGREADHIYSTRKNCPKCGTAMLTWREFDDKKKSQPGPKIMVKSQ